MKSMAYSNHPLSAVLRKALEIIGGNARCMASGPYKEKQQNLLEQVQYIPDSDCSSLGMETIASYSADEINGFLARHGFDIRLDTLDSNEFGVASVLKIFMTWLKEAKECTLNAKDGNVYTGAQMEGSALQLFGVSGREEKVICIQPKEDFTLYMALNVARPENEQDLFTLAAQFSASKRRNGSEVTSLLFPEVEIDTQPDISWLCGLSSGKNVITQALMQTKFKLHKKGASAEAAAAIGVKRCMCSEEKLHLVIDQPFMAWIEKPGISLPTFVAYCDYDSWKK